MVGINQVKSLETKKDYAIYQEIKDLLIFQCLNFNFWSIVFPGIWRNHVEESKYLVSLIPGIDDCSGNNRWHTKILENHNVLVVTGINHVDVNHTTH